MTTPFLFQGDHFGKEVDFPLAVLGQGVVHDEQAVVVDLGHLLDHPIHGSWTKAPPPEVADTAGVAVESAAPGGMHQVHHLDPLVIVEIPLQDVAPRGADDLRRRRRGEEVVDGLEAVPPPVGEDLIHPTLGLAEKNGVGVLPCLFGMEHRSDPPADHPDAPAPVVIRDLPAPLHLAGQHHGDADKIDVVIGGKGLHVLVDELHLPIQRQGRGKDYRTVRGQMEFRLPL